MAWKWYDWVGTGLTGGLYGAGKLIADKINESNGWEDNKDEQWIPIEEAGEKIKEGAETVGEKIKEGADRLTGRDIQEETLDYQKWYDANKYQLTAQDMALAGLSKTLSAGSGQSTAVQSQQGVNQLNGVMSILSTITQMKGAAVDMAVKKQTALKMANDNNYYAEHGYFPDSAAAKYQQFGSLIKEGLGLLKPKFDSVKDGVISYSQDVKESALKASVEAAAKAARVESLKSEKVVGKSKKVDMNDKNQYQSRTKLPGSNHWDESKKVPVYQRGGR